MTAVRLTIAPKATFTPAVGMAGSVTPITFSSGSEGGFIVLQEHNCSNAHLAVTNGSFLASTAIAQQKVSTTVAMSKAASVKVCYASKESHGDSADDYSTLDTMFVQRTALSFTPMRTMYGVAQSERVGCK